MKLNKDVSRMTVAELKAIIDYTDDMLLYAVAHEELKHRYY